MRTSISPVNGYGNLSVRPRHEVSRLGAGTFFKDDTPDHFQPLSLGSITSEGGMTVRQLLSQLVYMYEMGR